MVWFFPVIMTLISAGQPGVDQYQTVLAGVQEVYDAVVSPEGPVDYRKLNGDPALVAKLDAFAKYMETVDPGAIKDPAQRIAMLSNTYNVLTLIGVNRAWPVTSVRKIHLAFGFFTRNKWRVNGKKMSLNDIENKLLRPLDVRIHFIINCASASCPRILPQVLTAANVHTLMDKAAKDFLNDSSKNQFGEDGVWRLSKIFDWYGKDWQDKAGLVRFIQKYRSDLAPVTPAKIEYLDYDWSLNGPVEP